MSLIDLVFPKSCLNCGKSGTYICSACVLKLPLPIQTCPFCQKPSIDGVTHTKCSKKWGINGIYSIFSYRGVIRKAILKLKFKYADDIVSELVKHSISKLCEDNVFPNRAILTPIPLYWYKENVRGFNQSTLVGKQIAEKMGWNFREDILLRKKLKKSQSLLKGDERHSNILGVFSVSDKYSLVPSATVILFDDVYTTGSTLREAAKVLKRRGVEKVWGLTIAK